ncbi:PqqD family protein [Nocardioides jishulii]|uniref:PqqD family protein n=1 Tax=Nocardioides jishulii TaxID=2575440 RepID=A0A4U2YKQ4_9ACTN|nr:PqqD family protein [Nocardioides jishulii]QCX26749.1 PqqD family protein [Nocardioides jishulii]TKI60281.1 PqqD family protein [Nocardioides jishulii]
MTALARRTSVLHVGDAARVVLLDLDDAAHPPRILTGPAAEIWAAVDGRRSLADVTQEVAEAFGAPVDEVADDVSAFVATLLREGLLQEVA